MRNERARLPAAGLATLALLLMGPGCGPKDTTATAPPTPPGARNTGSGPNDGSSQTPAEPRKEGPTLSLTSEQYFKEYKADKKAARKKYKDATIVLSGKAVGVTVNVANQGMIFLKAKADADYPWVTCLLPDDPEPFARYAPGQTMKVRGAYPENDFSDDPILIRCAVVEAGPNPAITMTASKLADELADAKAAVKKYEGKYLIVTGEVDSVEKREKGGAIVYLKGNGKTRVPLGFAPVDGEKYQRYKVGSSVKVFGKFDEGNFDQPALRDCELITR